MKVSGLAFLVFFLSLACCPAFGQGAPVLSQGQTLYLPIYSHIWHGEAGTKDPAEKTLISALVSIRNTDPKKSIRIISAQYYDTDGKKLKEYVPAAKTIGPMATLELFVPRSDDSGGSGANFVISWKAEATVNAPLIDALHVYMTGARSISFITSARPIAVD
ncbi:MAG: DUF3124 domain-containing protein [Betaproteobacteria bacterium]|nr:DUF3124 domain-containing protein [Betaproteobacteria bacterium]